VTAVESVQEAGRAANLTAAAVARLSNQSEAAALSVTRLRWKFSAQSGKEAQAESALGDAQQKLDSAEIATRAELSAVKIAAESELDPEISRFEETLNETRAARSTSLGLAREIVEENSDSVATAVELLRLRGLEISSTNDEETANEKTDTENVSFSAHLENFILRESKFKNSSAELKNLSSAVSAARLLRDTLASLVEQASANLTAAAPGARRLQLAVDLGSAAQAEGREAQAARDRLLGEVQAAAARARAELSDAQGSVDSLKISLEGFGAELAKTENDEATAEEFKLKVQALLSQAKIQAEEISRFTNDATLRYRVTDDQCNTLLGELRFATKSLQEASESEQTIALAINAKKEKTLETAQRLQETQDARALALAQVRALGREKRRVEEIYQTALAELSRCQV